MTKVSSHPDRKNPEYKLALARVREEVKSDLAKLEQWKPELRKRYERYQESLQRIEATRSKERERNAVQLQSGNSSRRGSLDFTLPADHSPYGVSHLLNAGEHSDIALKLAHRSLGRREISQGEATDLDDLTRGIRDIGQLLERKQLSETSSISTPGAYNYPSVPSADRRPGITSTTPASNLPTRPTKDIDHHSSYVPPSAPRPPPKLTQGLLDSAPPLPAKASKDVPLPAIPHKEDLSSSNYTFQPLAFTESGAPLRTVFLPTELRPQFLSIAAANTRAKLETCGILCGTLISNALFISHLVIPDQTSTSDTCETTDEGETTLFDYVDGEALMVCGWIHTHPTQTCFLSSRDLHTSVGYQVMLPESVAIVCAPSQSPDHGIFRLTDPAGKQAILDCHQSGLFHPHAQTNLYTDALRPGHVSELKGLQFQVVDLRKKK